MPKIGEKNKIAGAFEIQIRTRGSKCWQKSRSWAISLL